MKVLLAIDGSSGSDVAVNEVATRPWPADTEIEVFSVAKLQVPNTPDPLLLAATTYQELVESERQQAHGFVVRAVENLRQGAGTKDLHITAKVTKGYPQEVILNEANEWGADLIVMGSHGHSLLGRFLLGSVTHAVVGHASCSVEIVRHRP